MFASVQRPKVIFVGLVGIVLIAIGYRLWRPVHHYWDVAYMTPAIVVVRPKGLNSFTKGPCFRCLSIIIIACPGMKLTCDILS